MSSIVFTGSSNIKEKGVLFGGGSLISSTAVHPIEEVEQSTELSPIKTSKQLAIGALKTFKDSKLQKKHHFSMIGKSSKIVGNPSSLTSV